MELLRTGLIGVCLLLLGGGAAVQAQPDSVRAKILEAKGFSPDHSPRGALWRGAVLPGWGQVYNRQYYKVPFVYGGFAGLGFRAYRSHQRYLLFRRAHLYGRGEDMAEEGEANPYRQYQEEFNRVEEFVGGRLSKMRNQRDRFRRRRDLAILGAGVFYALTLLDAYVSAHLLTFDVGEELSLRVQPTGPFGRPSGGQKTAVARSTGGLGFDSGPGVHLQLRF